MEREEIIRGVQNLPLKLSGEWSEHHHIFQGTEEGVRFQVTKELIPIEDMRLVVYSISFKGVLDSREKVIAQFMDILGEPLFTGGLSSFLEVQIVVWDAKGVDEKIKK